MRDTLHYLIIVAIIVVNNFNNLIRAECCEPKSILFRPKYGLNCYDFPNSKPYVHGSICPTDYKKYSGPICEIRICKDGKHREYCSDGECTDCDLWIFRCKDTAVKCYGDHNTFEEAFANVWAEKNYGVRDYVGSEGVVVKFKKQNNTQNWRDLELFFKSLMVLVKIDV